MVSQDFSITKTSHTGITVLSLQSALAFWHELLGFAIIYRTHFDCSPDLHVVGLPDARIEIALLRLPDGSMLELLEYTHPADRKDFRPRPCDVGNVHLALEVTGSRALIAAATKLGWRAVADVPQAFQRGDGSRWTAIYMHGPDGETVELMEKVG